MHFAKNSSDQIDSWSVVQARRFLIQTRQARKSSSLIGFFLSGLSSFMRALPALLKLASVIRTSCFPEMGCFNASSHASLSALLTESKVTFSSEVMLIGTSAFKSV